MSILQALRIRISYRFLHTIAIFAAILRSLHGFPATEVFSISESNNNSSKHGTIIKPPELNLEDFWLKLGIVITLVVLGGIFAGLTIGLMGLDETNLQVLVVSGEYYERIYAKKVLNLLQRGKHWVLVTLLLSNVIVNETLPIIFDSVLGGGWPAVLISTALIVMFGEIIPQAVCVRYGLAIGAKLSWFVVFLMYALLPVAYPIALILDFCLGEQHGTMYRRSELKTFVSLHKDGGLDDDEIQIIGSVLDLRAKRVSEIMTPLEDVFTLRADEILSQEVLDEIQAKGYSRIPVYEPPNPNNFIGMLLVKKLITYHPEDPLMVKDFQLSPLPETGPLTSCLEILNYFQEGRSHMVLVSRDPGGDGGALGILTLEDVIEELIGEEIIDETDVYVDVHNKIKVERRPPRQIRPRSYYSFLSRRNKKTAILRNYSTNDNATTLSITALKGKNKDTNNGENSRSVFIDKSKLKSGQNSIDNVNIRNNEDTGVENERGGMSGSTNNFIDNDNDNDLMDIEDKDHEFIGLIDGVNTHKKEP